MATRSTNVESDESTMSQNAVVSCNRRLLAPAIARTRLNIHLRSEDFVRIVLRGVYTVNWRYQGLSRSPLPNAQEAIERTTVAIPFPHPNSSLFSLPFSSASLQPRRFSDASV